MHTPFYVFLLLIVAREAHVIDAQPVRPSSKHNSTPPWNQSPEVRQQAQEIIDSFRSLADAQEIIYNQALGAAMQALDALRGYPGNEGLREKYLELREVASERLSLWQGTKSCIVEHENFLRVGSDSHHPGSSSDAGAGSHAYRAHSGPMNLNK